VNKKFPCKLIEKNELYDIDHDNQINIDNNVNQSNNIKYLDIKNKSIVSVCQTGNSLNFVKKCNGKSVPVLPKGKLRPIPKICEKNIDIDIGNVINDNSGLDLFTDFNDDSFGKKTENKICTCPYCLSQFSELSNLNKHIRLNRCKKLLLIESNCDDADSHRDDDLIALKKEFAEFKKTVNKNNVKVRLRSVNYNGKLMH